VVVIVRHGTNAGWYTDHLTVMISTPVKAAH
jgi:hypothetical protein